MYNVTRSTMMLRDSLMCIFHLNMNVWAHSGEWCLGERHKSQFCVAARISYFPRFLLAYMYLPQLILQCCEWNTNRTFAMPSDSLGNPWQFISIEMSNILQVHSLVLTDRSATSVESNGVSRTRAIKGMLIFGVNVSPHWGARSPYNTSNNNKTENEQCLHGDDQILWLLFIEGLLFT